MIEINELRSMVNGAHFESFANSVINSLLDRIEAIEKERDSLRAKIATTKQTSQDANEATTEAVASTAGLGALLPCPFCGGEAGFDHDDNGWVWIDCSSCGASTNARVSAMDDCKPLLAEQWNRRATPPDMKLVPVEPTPEMMDAANRDLRREYATLGLEPGHYLLTPKNGGKPYTSTTAPDSWELRECHIQWVPDALSQPHTESS